MAMKQRLAQIHPVTNNQLCVTALGIQNNKVFSLYILAVFYYEACIHVKQLLPARELMSISKLLYTFLVSEPPRIDGSVHFNIP